MNSGLGHEYWAILIVSDLTLSVVSNCYFEKKKVNYMFLFKSQDIAVLLMDLQTLLIVNTQSEIISVSKKESLIFILRIWKKTLIL